VPAHGPHLGEFTLNARFTPLGSLPSHVENAFAPAKCGRLYALQVTSPRMVAPDLAYDSLPTRALEHGVTISRTDVPSQVVGAPFTLWRDFIAHPLTGLLEIVLHGVEGFRGTGFNTVPSGFSRAFGRIQLFVQLGRVVA